MAKYLTVFRHAGFFFALGDASAVSTARENLMDEYRGERDGQEMNIRKSSMAKQIAQAAIAFEQRRTGNHGPQSVTVVLSEGTLVITLHGALSPAETALAKNPAGAAQIQDYHRQLFAGSSESLRHEITRITGMEVREATAEVEPATGAVVHAFTTGTMVQVFMLDGGVPMETWSENAANSVSSLGRAAS